MALLGPSNTQPEGKTKFRLSWANIVSSKTSGIHSEPPLHLQKNHFEKIKNTTRGSVTIDNELWQVSPADLPNGYYFIRCESPEMQGRLLWEGPWTMAGWILQLSPWRESFQLPFEKLETTTVWLKIYHLPIELWAREILETIGSQFD